MNRKEFLIKTGLTAAGTAGIPYLLPSGRLWAKTQSLKADHVVLVMFAGGVRQQESVLQRYLEDSQEVSGAGGNIMYNLFEGGAPTKKIAYGTDPAGGTRGADPIPKLLTNTIQKQGVLFPEMRAQSAGHYVGLNTLLTGNPGVSQGLRVRPRFPTIFEYIRKHAGFKTTDCWFIGSGIGNSTPLLNSSNHPDYGLAYGANFFAAPVTFSGFGRDILGDAKVYSDAELNPMYEMKDFLDLAFGLDQSQYSTVRNTPEERTVIKGFVRDVFRKLQTGQIPFPPVNSNGDSVNIGFAAEVLKFFKPRLLALNIGAVDSCHSNFTDYLRALHRADHATGWLWNYIQTQIPEMSGNTVIIIAPECGRNLNPNPILDENDWYAYDHSDANALRVWGLMAGKSVPSNAIMGSESAPMGRLTDIVPTIADIFGIKDKVMASGFIDPLANSLWKW